MKNRIQSLFVQALRQLPVETLEKAGQLPVPEIERTRDPSHGDFASNLAMKLAKPCRMNPRELAAQLIAALPDSPLIDKTEIAGPGFVNVYLSADAYHQQLHDIIESAETYGCQPASGKKIIVEFISANPTGPLHVGHGRLAAYGASLSNLLVAAGNEVFREYYVNDAGRQMAILAASLWLRYLESHGAVFVFPQNGYKGDYITRIADDMKLEHADKLVVDTATVFANLPADGPDGDEDKFIDALIERARETLGEQGFGQVLDFGLKKILDDIRDDLEEFGVHIDRWYAEHDLHSDGAIDETLKLLRANKNVFEKDGAVWFRATDFGDEKDRVVVRENGQTTYFASDIAYHLEKRQRGFDLLLDVLGADHHGYVARVRAGLEATGQPAESLEVRLMQFVALFRGGEKVQMSTRSGDFVTLRELRREVGNDAARFFYVLRSNDQHLDFDLELAKSHSSDNPVYYIQYAHARICSVMQQMSDKGFDWQAERAWNHLEKLNEQHEKALIVSLSRYPEVISLSAKNRAPHTLAHYLRDLANDFHTYYNAHTFLVEDQDLRDARIALIVAVRQVIANGLALLGVSAPESM
ncbi:MAG: arginine--tRNA ligase [Gammaproteobacteria bacterium]|nr:arginine--tRNA ligase [Gammaproteobacteria bacterium]